MIDFSNARPFTMADFENVGRPRRRAPEIPPAFPPTLRLTSPHTVRVRGVPFDLLQDKIREFLYQFEELTQIKWEDKWCCWKIEYGTTPLEWQPEYSALMPIIDRCRRVYWQAATKARKRNGDEVFMNDDYEYPRRWARMELRIYSDPKVSTDFVLHLNRMCGDSVSHYYIWNHFREFFKTENTLFWVRGPMLHLLDGIPLEHQNTTHTYLFNELIVCDICTYLAGEPTVPLAHPSLINSNIY